MKYTEYMNKNAGSFNQEVQRVNAKEYIELGKTVIDVGAIVIRAAQKKKKIKSDKLRALSNKGYDMSYQYNRVILENFVARKFQYYGKNRTKKISISRVKREIESRRYPQKNIIIVGSAGIGKSTVLKWLFLNSNARNCDYIYLYAKMFSKCDKLKDVLDAITKIIPADNPSVVFLDGLDEMNCIKGENHELQQLLSFFDHHSSPIRNRLDCKFVISTRPEHFEFNDMIINKNIEDSTSNYAIFEMEDLTSNESYRICKSIKKLWEYDQKEEYKNFLDKWPSKKEDGYLTEKEYIDLLKKYIKNVEMGRSLLKSPLLCRYAYQIICEWNYQDKKELEQMHNTQCERIQKVLKICIKWEFHDGYTGQTESRKGKKLLEIYSQQVISFLTDIAGEMGSEESIERKYWYKLKNKSGIKNINKVYCGLQEDEDGNLRFIHQSFKNFFLARYYVLMLNNRKENNEFIHLLELSSELAVMYIELLMKEGNALAKKVCNDILSRKNEDINRLAEYARGTLRFIYNTERSFTAADFFTVFPYGKFLYAGIELDKDKFEELKINGILKIKNLNILRDYTESAMYLALGINIIGLELECRNMRTFSFHFWIYENENLHRINGVEINPLDPVKRKELAYIGHQEHVVIFDALNKMIHIMGNKKRYWCFFDEETLFFYQMINKNEGKMASLFINGCIKDSRIFATFYGIYKAMVSDKNMAIQIGSFSRVCNIPFSFCAKDRITNNNEDPLVHYYIIHVNILQLLKIKIELHDGKNYEDAAQKLDIELTEISKNNSNDKLKLYLADEQLFIYYLLEWREKMVKLAQVTLELCKKYEHSEGIMFREFLIRDDVYFKVDDLHKVYIFAKDYIWI